MTFTKRLTSAVAATLIGGAALTLTTATAAEARPAGLAEMCASYDGYFYQDAGNWTCVAPIELAGPASGTLRDLCFDIFDPEYSEDTWFTWAEGDTPDLVELRCSY